MLKNSLSNRHISFLFAGAIICIFFNAFQLGSNSYTNMVVCLLILLFGLPHGSFDIMLLKDKSTHLKFFIKMLGYMLAALVFILMWWIAPTLSLLLFLVISVLHFGDSDWPHDSVEFKLIWGLSMVGLTFLFDKELSTEILTIISMNQSVHILAEAIHIAAIVFTPLAIILSLKHTYKLLCLLMIIAVYALTTPLIGFAFYFCLFHSVNHLAFWKTRISENNANLIINLVSISIVLAVVFVGLNKFESVNIEDEWIRITFILLAALTLPHIVIVYLKKKQFNR